MDEQRFVSEVQLALRALSGSGQLAAWSLRRTESRSSQRLYAAVNGLTLRCHQSRRVADGSFQVTVYVPLEEELQWGMATMDLVTFRAIEDQLSDAMACAKNSSNRRWKLAGMPAEAPVEVVTCDAQIRDMPESVMQQIEGRFVAAMAQTQGCQLNSAELFVNYCAIEVMNSEGLAYRVERSDLYLEAAMEAAGRENDKEVHEYATAVALADLDVEAFVAQCAMQVAVLGDSDEPETAESAVILIDKMALSQMLEAVVQQLNVANEYQRFPFLKEGDLLGGGSGDALTLTLDPAVPCMALSGAYSAEGLPARSGLVIEKNVVKERLIGNRYGQYLELKPNGVEGNMMVEAGTLSREALCGQAYLEIIKFSSLLIDPRKLTWSSEIKLGKRVGADGSETLVKGGVVSGNLKENFVDCHFSRTIGTVNMPGTGFDAAVGYRGPEWMLIRRGVSVAGKREGVTE
jgi:predicted Zn-dependent protease